ncbi:MAG: FAD-binding oxidoreductase [Rhodocyclaceae bacterium]|nr:FAD-binding oxidoreductase [Rhodocyclaceae bacterium]
MIESTRVQALQGSFAGELLLPGESGYDECRKVFNAMHDRRPALIARCASSADVAAAVNFARQNGLVVAVRCGGHSVAGLSTCDDGILIDLGGLKKMEVDPTARTARAGGGVLWGEFDAATQLHGLHTPGGRVTTTGIGGFTTGGGYGWTSSKYGLTCDNLISAEVVLADGRVVSCSEKLNDDLFWGIRGGGSNFGIVTEFEYRLHPLGPLVLAGLALWPIERAGDVLRAWRDYVDGAPDELSTACVILTAPPEPFVPDHLKGQVALGMAVMYVGNPEDGKAIVQPLKDLRPAVDLIQPMPYTVFQSLLDPMAPKGYRSYWRGEYCKGFPDGAIDTFIQHAPQLTAAAPPLSQTIIFRVGQGVAATADSATAFSHRDADYLFHPISMWQQATDDARLIAINRAFCDAMRPYSTGSAYLNFSPEDRVRDAYGAAKHARLVALKDRYDPHNLFKLNQNIEPAGGPSARLPA